MRAFLSALLNLIASIHLMAGPVSHPSSSQVDLITQLYQEFAWETVIDSPDIRSRGFLDQSKQSLLRYLTPSLTSLILRDRAFAIKTHTAGRLDFQPIWNSQDVIGTTLRISPSSYKNLITVSLNRCGRESEITYLLVSTKNGWRIADILYDQHDLPLSTLLKSNQ
jgi:hypothetical protein